VAAPLHAVADALPAMADGTANRLPGPLDVTAHGPSAMRQLRACPVHPPLHVVADRFRTAGDLQFPLLPTLSDRHSDPSVGL